MNVDLDDEERRLILNALAKLRIDLRSTLGAGDVERLGLDPDLAFGMGMTALDQINGTANGIAEKLGGNSKASDFGASAIGPDGQPADPFQD